MKCLLVLDRYGYKINEEQYKKIVEARYSECEIVYTKYEDKVIRKVRNWPFVGNAMLHLLRWIKSFKYALYANSHNDINTIICLNPIVGIMIALLGAKDKKLIVCGFLFENKKNKYYYCARKFVTKMALQRISTVVVYGSSEVSHYEKLFELPNKFRFIQYGIDYLNQSAYTGKSLPQNYIFSGGGSNRDYKTLINAYNLIYRENEIPPLVCATQQWRLSGLNLSNCIVLTDVVNETFGDVMKGSKLLVLSLKNTQVSAGHMVMLQAMSLGVPILINDIPAIRDYVDERCVTFYKSGDEKQLAEMIIACTCDKKIENKAAKAKKYYEDNFTSSSLIARLLSL